MISIDSSGNKRGGGGQKEGEPPTEGSTVAEDQALWDQVMTGVKPLAGARKVVPAVSGNRVPSTPRKGRTAEKPLPKPVARTPGDQEVDRRTDQKLKRGQYPVDFTLDLHGLTQAAARDKLQATLRRSYTQGLRCVLVITGKGRGEGQGVLRRKVPEWLAEEALRPIVLRFHAAQPEHGGGGALYVLLRRKRTVD